MGFFDRLANLWRGFTSLFLSNVESKNPEAVYEAAIEERKRRYEEMKRTVAGIVYLRNKLQDELEEKEKALADIQAQIPVAVDEGQDDVALVLIQRKDELVARITELKGELAKLVDQVDDAKAGLIAFREEIEKLRREKEEMLARKATAEARLEIQRSLDGLSTDADIQALENVRTHIKKLQAEADVGAELEGASLEGKLEEIRKKVATASAQAQLEELKKAREAQRNKAAQQVASTVKKTV